MKVGKEVEPADKRWILEVVVKYPERITERQARALLKGFLHLGLAGVKTNEPLPTFEVIP